MDFNRHATAHLPLANVQDRWPGRLLSNVLGHEKKRTRLFCHPMIGRDENCAFRTARHDHDAIQSSIADVHTVRQVTPGIVLTKFNGTVVVDPLDRKPDGNRFSSFVMGVVESVPFLMRTVGSTVAERR